MTRLNEVQLKELARTLLSKKTQFSANILKEIPQDPGVLGLFRFGKFSYTMFGDNMVQQFEDLISSEDNEINQRIRIVHDLYHSTDVRSDIIRLLEEHYEIAWLAMDGQTGEFVDYLVDRYNPFFNQEWGMKISPEKLIKERQLYKNSFRSWKPEEDELLLKLFDSGTCTIEISKALHRTKEAMWRRLATLGRDKSEFYLCWDFPWYSYDLSRRKGLLTPED